MNEDIDLCRTMRKVEYGIGVSKLIRRNILGREK